MKLLITGASGLYGSKLTELSIKKGFKVYSGYSNTLPQKGIATKMDIEDGHQVKVVIDKISPDVIVHAASMTDVDKCEINRDLAWKTNVEGTKNIVESAKTWKIPICYISTDYVFDGKKGNYSEKDEPNPINYYGLTKYNAEQFVSNNLKNYVIARTSVIFGASPAAGKVNFALWLINKLKERLDVNIIEDQFISPTLNTNLPEMTLEIIDRRINGIFHLSGATRINRYDFAVKIAEVFNLDSNLIHPSKSEKMSWVAKRPFDSSLNTLKAYRLLDHKPKKVQKSLRQLKNELS